MLSPNTILEGKALEELLEREANKHENSIIDKLSQFDPNELFHVWRNFLWYVEEFINMNFELQEDELIRFNSYRIDYNYILNASLIASKSLSDAKINVRISWIVIGSFPKRLATSKIMPS